jgi:hypothetical protein
MEDLEAKEAAGAAVGKFSGNGDPRGLAPGPGSRRSEEGPGQKNTHRPPAGEGGSPGRRSRAVVEGAWVRKELNGGKREEHSQSENRAGLSPSNLLHLSDITFIASGLILVNAGPI